MLIFLYRQTFCQWEDYFPALTNATISLFICHYGNRFLLPFQKAPFTLRYLRANGCKYFIFRSW